MSKNGALTDLLYYVGGLAVGSRLTMEVECDKVEIVNPLLLPQEYEMEYVQSFFDPRFTFLGSEWLPNNRIPLETELQELKYINTMSKPSVERVNPQMNRKTRGHEYCYSLREKN